MSFTITWTTLPASISASNCFHAGRLKFPPLQPSNEDTDYEDEYDADDSDYIVDDEDEDEDENALWDDAEEDTDEPPEKKRRKRKKKDLFADSDTDAENAEAEEYEKTRRRLAKEQRIIDEIEADAAENPIEDDGDDAGEEQPERKLLKRELRAQALKRLEDSA